MMRFGARLIKRLVRTAAIVLLVVLGSTILVRFAPGYLSDAREMDPRYSGSVRTELAGEAARSGTLTQMLSHELREWTQGSLGLSRQFEVPVLELIGPRMAVTGSLLLKGILFAWTLALGAALLSSAGPNPKFLWQTPATILIAVPTAAMATVCLLAETGGPVTVLTLLLAARDFKFLDRILRKTWHDPHLLQARAQGIRTGRLLLAYILPTISSQISALATLSTVTALSALVPVEVIFNVPGVGQLAWNAAMNRDLPVLLAVTMIMAVAVTLAGMASSRPAEDRTA